MALLAAGMILVMLSGCGCASEMEFNSAGEAKEALNTASEIEIFADLYTESRKTDILADGKVAGTLRGNTVFVDGEEWFHMDYVTDDPINNREGPQLMDFMTVKTTVWGMPNCGTWTRLMGKEIFT